MPEKISFSEIHDPTDWTPRCADFDEDCEEVACKIGCWLYDINRGYCPYLRTN